MKKKSKKPVKKKKVVKPPPPLDLYRVDMELYDTGKLTYAVYYPTRHGTTDEPMTRTMAEMLHDIGQGGRLVIIENGKERVLETWGGIGRVLAAKTIEECRLAYEREYGPHPPPKAGTG